MGNAQRRKKLEIYPEQTSTVQSLELEADKVFASFGLPFSSLSECYRSAFLSQSLFAQNAWTLWKAYLSNSQGFSVYQEGHPKSEFNGLRFVPNSEYWFCSKMFNIPERTSTHQMFLSSLRDPSKLMLYKFPPPTIVVLHDGLPGGSFVSQWCLGEARL